MCWCRRVGGVRVIRPGCSVAVRTVARRAPVLVEPDGFGPRDAVWDVPWLEGLRRVPRDATWPRLMTVPHPRAVGSLGTEVARWARLRRGRPWRWWQRLSATRLLEVDARRASWCGRRSLLTLARQLGKTWFLHDICSWRLEQGDRFGGPQEIVSIAKDLAVVRKMQQPARARAKSLPDLYKVREVNGQEEIELLVDGSRWMIRSKDGVYGLTASMATVDEAWKVAASIVDDGLVPTMIEQAQIAVAADLDGAPAGDGVDDRPAGRRLGPARPTRTPTAGRCSSSGRRHRTAELDDRQGVAAGVAVLDGETGTVDRRTAGGRAGRRVRRRRRTGPDRVVPDAMVEPVAGETVATSARARSSSTATCGTARSATTTRDGPLVIGVEDHHGRGAAVGFCGELPDGRFVLGGELCRTRAEAYAFAAQAAVGPAGVDAGRRGVAGRRRRARARSRP